MRRPDCATDTNGRGRDRGTRQQERASRSTDVQSLVDPARHGASSRPLASHDDMEPPMAFTIKINGASHVVDVDGDTALLWVLRDVLGMTGTKFGCGMALCGACTVHVDGAATRSCVLPLGAVKAKSITTIEGLSSDRGHAVQKAWLEIDVPQCGYCQSGQIMSAAALLKANPQPSDADID